ncbi:MAG: DNA polymerase III subunit epsilon [Parvibaculales bacterium]
MREIALDTETTGLKTEDGDRIVEIGCVELINHTPTGKNLQIYLNPQRPMSEGALRITNLTDEFLSDKPLFEHEVDKFLTFVGDAPLIIHNAPFDMGFLNFELEKSGRPALDNEVIDTLVIARKKFPGARNTLDALCQRFNVDNSGREYHGALLDSLLLAEVYLELIGGRQPGLVFQQDGARQDAAQKAQQEAQEMSRQPRAPRPTALPPRLNAEAHSQHMAFLETLPTPAKWLNPDTPKAETAEEVSRD